MTNERPDTYEEIAAYYEGLTSRGKEMERLVPVNARVKSEGGTIYSVRFTRQDMDRISKKAAQKGVKISVFIRTAALAAAEEDLKLEAGEKATKLRKAKQQAKALAESLDGL